jgi:hypothetical protein
MADLMVFSRRPATATVNLNRARDEWRPIAREAAAVNQAARVPVAFRIAAIRYFAV